MPRPTRARAFRNPLHPDVQHFFETGEERARPGTEEGFLCWLCRGRLPEGVALWEQHRDHVLARWREAGRPGLPWAEKHFKS